MCPANRRLAAGFTFTRQPGGGWRKTVDKMKIRASHILIAALVSLLLLLNLTSLILNATAYWQINRPMGWRDEVYLLEGGVACYRALDNFRDGHLRLYRLGGESEKDIYTGTNDGPFEIWTPQFYPSLGPAHLYSKEQFIQFYNGKMRHMYAHPDKFQRKPKQVQPQHPADGSQPSRSVSNSTPEAARSRR